MNSVLKGVNSATRHKGIRWGDWPALPPITLRQEESWVPTELKAGKGGGPRPWPGRFPETKKSLLPLPEIAPSVAEPAAFSVSRFARHSLSETNYVGTGTYRSTGTCNWSRTLWLFLSITQCTVGKGKGKRKDDTRTGHESPDGEERYSSILSLTSALDGVGGQRQVPAALTPGRPGTHCMGG
jgi:hypothetical protein